MHDVNSISVVLAEHRISLRNVRLTSSTKRLCPGVWIGEGLKLFSPIFGAGCFAQKMACLFPSTVILML